MIWYHKILKYLYVCFLVSFVLLYVALTLKIYYCNTNFAFKIRIAFIQKRKIDSKMNALYIYIWLFIVMFYKLRCMYAQRE